MINFGAEALSSLELLSLIIGRGVPGRSVLSIAQELLETYGSIHEISQSSIEELTKIRGIGKAKAIQLKACFELGKRQELDIAKKNFIINNPKSVYELVKRKIFNKSKEHLLLIILDTRNKVISISNVSTGILNSNLVHPREVYKEAIHHNAASIIIAHNHPSGNPEPSEEDKDITNRLVEAGKIVGINVLDHIIIGKDSYFSFKEKGYL